MPRRDEERFMTLSPDHEAQDHAATEGHGHRHLHRAARQLHGAGYCSGNRIQRRQDLLYSHAGNQKDASGLTHQYKVRKRKTTYFHSDWCSIVPVLVMPQVRSRSELSMSYQFVYK